MKTDILKQVAAIAEALQIHSQNSFSFAGSSPVSVGTYNSTDTRHSTADPLTLELRNILYSHAYARVFTGKLRQVAQPSPAPDSNFTAALSAANQGREAWEPDWTIYQMGSRGQIFVRKGERCRPAVPGEFLTDGAPGRAPQIGISVSLRINKDSNRIQPGFFFVFGETLSDNFDDFSLVRIYFNTSAEYAPKLVKALSVGLNRYQVPFRFKCLSDPALYDRTDSAVLYVSKRHYRISAAIVAEALRNTILVRDEGIPLFSKFLAPGVGFAEDPATGESFGMHRCKVLADALVYAWRENVRDTAARMQVVENIFRRNNIDLERPWLNPHSVDNYELEVATELQL